MKYNKKGFTLVEVIVAIALIGIISVSIIPAFATYFKIMVNTKDITIGAFSAQGEMESIVTQVKGVLSPRFPYKDVPENEKKEIAGLSLEKRGIFSSYSAAAASNVSMYKVSKAFTKNGTINFTVFLSEQLAEREFRVPLVARLVKIDISNETTQNNIAYLAKSNEIELLGSCSELDREDNWYVDIYNWYVSNEGKPQPQFPADFVRIPREGITPPILSNLARFANRYIVFTVIPVDIHSVRGSETPSNPVYVLGAEWRAGRYVWVDKDLNGSFVASTGDATDFEIRIKEFTASWSWNLLDGFDSSKKFLDPYNVDKLLDPKGGALYVPMVAQRDFIAITGGLSGGPIKLEDPDHKIDWRVDKSINLAADIKVNNDSTMKMRALDGNIILYQYILLSSTNAAILGSNGLVQNINNGPTLETNQGDILMDTENHGNIIFQKFATLKSGGNINLNSFGNIDIDGSVIRAKGSIYMNATDGTSYYGGREIAINGNGRPTQISLDSNTSANRVINISSLNKILISNTGIIGNEGLEAASEIKLNAPGGTNLDNVNFTHGAIKLSHNGEFFRGGWSEDSTIFVQNEKELVFGKSEADTKINNDGLLNLGNTGRVSFEKKATPGAVMNKVASLEVMKNPLSVSLTRGMSYSTVSVGTTNYVRNVGYADRSGYEDVIPGIYKNLGSGNTNFTYTVEEVDNKWSQPDISCLFDGDQTISIKAVRKPGTEGLGKMDADYKLKVKDSFSNGVGIGEIYFTVKASESGDPEVVVRGDYIPARPVIQQVGDAYVKHSLIDTWEAPPTTATDDIDGIIPSSSITTTYSTEDTAPAINVTDIFSARMYLKKAIDNTVRVAYNVSNSSGRSAVEGYATFTSIPDDITEATVIISPPAVGQLQQTFGAVQLATNSLDFDVTDLVWKNAAGAITINQKFIADETYTAMVTLKSKNFKRFIMTPFTPKVLGSTSVTPTTPGGAYVVGNNVSFVVSYLVDISAADVKIKAPVGGAVRETAAQVQTETNNPNYTVTGLVWNETMSSGNKFTANKTYTATVTLQSKNAKRFIMSPFTPTVLNSSAVTPTTAEGGYVVGNTVSFTVSYIVDITAATVKITAPKKNTAPQTAAQVEAATKNADYTVTGLVWNGTLKPNGQFDTKKTYTATVTLQSKNSKRFTMSPFSPTINSTYNSVTLTESSGGYVIGNSVSFTITFKPTT